MQNPIPKLVTFDGEARSGKGTVVGMVKDYLRDELSKKVMLIDRGQTFRVLVVAATRAGVDVDDPEALDAFLSSEENIAACVQFVKDVYHMGKDERDSLLYTNEVGENSAKVGARPASQEFVKSLTKKWLHDAGNEGYEVVLIDGRALEAIAREMHAENLCDYRLGLYFVCDDVMGARRTLGYAATQYEDLTDEQRQEVDALVEQIYTRNHRDHVREVEPLVLPADAPICRLPGGINDDQIDPERPMVVVDTSADMTKHEMSMPVAELVARYIA
ncbi:MAG: (d)CMP kinase [Acidobacteriota bacterium]